MQVELPEETLVKLKKIATMMDISVAEAIEFMVDRYDTSNSDKIIMPRIHTAKICYFWGWGAGYRSANLDFGLAADPSFDNSLAARLMADTPEDLSRRLDEFEDRYHLAVPLSEDGTHVFIDGFGDVPLQYPDHPKSRLRPK